MEALIYFGKNKFIYRLQSKDLKKVFKYTSKFQNSEAERIHC